MKKNIDTIFLIGYMGAGKTITGKALSKSLGYKFYDLDKYIEMMEGKTVSEIFNQKKEIYFRKIENKYLNDLCLKKEKKIISTGGGTPCFDNNLKIINNSHNSTSIYLKATVNSLVERLINSMDTRPIISHLKDKNELNEFIAKHLFERSFYYERSEIKITTDGLVVKDILSKIKENLV